ncbi:hypothetical protein [Polynucleobacter sp. UK-Kesae-W10]|uniref:hypothetical protein n=1 Tax=Polynucleobacter sp. UK-Kesae-W10 TaxID=1819738 RepID=UPI001C0B9529|nr:hypothetical protein [Polynucleobacter sp. UK-Kesae-W10]MBU3577540.1 hypothetical protein [Polynucleobacter sp. UK-Kesae-W10]
MAKKLFAQTYQFRKLMHRWMPVGIREMPEGRLVIHLLGQAFEDGDHWFFHPETQWFHDLCIHTGLDSLAVTEAYRKSSKKYFLSRNQEKFA